MEHIWAFLLQTLNGSVVALLLLLLKYILADKLSPRWQYTVWSLLALRLLVPSSVNRYILIPLPLWLETWKAKAEKLLDSAYSCAYAPIRVRHGFPLIDGQPQSVTDWLFLLYFIGAAACLLWYLFSYLRLRCILSQGSPASPERLRQLQHVGQKYGCRTCPMIEVHGLPVPFICGFFRPVLVFPSEIVLDDKIFLHELLHLKYKDAWQNIGWCLLRCLHWCNPFLQYVFNRIENDMETLCDQRVLEQLDGEERRSYGLILLKMANEPYARAPGTSSISNGRKNISRRIEAIVRFQKYPKGMALVSVCIIITLLSPALIGTANAYNQTLFMPVTASELDQAMASARINRCSTLAGALDTYAMGLMQENGLYIALASPLSAHAELEQEMRRTCTEDDWVAYHLDSGTELQYVVQGDGYCIYNIEPIAKSCYKATLGFSVSSFLNPDGIGWQTDDEGNIRSGSILVPVLVSNDGSWVVEEAGDRICSYTPLDQQQYPQHELPAARTLTATGTSGTVTVQNMIICHVEHTTAQVSNLFFSSPTYDWTPQLDAEFSRITTMDYITYTCPEELRPTGPKHVAGIQIYSLENANDRQTFETLHLPPDSAQSSNTGASAATQSVTKDWDGTVFSGSGSVRFNVPPEEIPVLPKAYQVQILWDGSVVEEFLIQEDVA